MAVGLYLDHNVRRAVAVGLRLRTVDVVTAFEDGSHRLLDPELLDRATELGRPLFTHDDDLVAEAARRRSRGVRFSGVIFAAQERLGIGQLVARREKRRAARSGRPGGLPAAVSPAARSPLPGASRDQGRGE